MPHKVCKCQKGRSRSAGQPLPCEKVLPQQSSSKQRTRQGDLRELLSNSRERTSAANELPIGADGLESEGEEEDTEVTFNPPD